MGFYLACVPSYYRIRPSLVFFLLWVYVCPFTNVISKYYAFIVSTDALRLMFLNSLTEGTKFLCTSKPKLTMFITIRRRKSLCLKYLEFFYHSILSLLG